MRLRFGYQDERLAILRTLIGRVSGRSPDA
jgi:hypothetical protein